MLMALSTHWVPTPLPSSPHPPNPAATAAEKSNPDTFIHFFVDHPQQLQAFLESVQHEPHASSTVYNTLLELYLRRGEEEEGKVNGAASSTALSSSDATSHPYAAQIMNLLKSFHGKYDMDHALVLCKLYHFEKGHTHTPHGTRHTLRRAAGSSLVAHCPLADLISLDLSPSLWCDQSDTASRVSAKQPQEGPCVCTATLPLPTISPVSVAAFPVSLLCV